MKTIEEYAIDLVCEGAEHCGTDDLNEEGEIAEEDHRAACDLAVEIAQAIRANPAVVLALVGRSSEPPHPLVHLEECEPERHEGWEKVSYRDALELGATMCEQTQYMADELFADEEVWLERPAP